MTSEELQYIESLKELKQLEDHWRQHFPNQALGGVRAINGFQYQFLVLLLETVKLWLQKTTAEQAQAVILSEILSDVVSIPRDGLVVITQVKRTQRSDSIAKALEELFSIYQLAQAETPHLLSKLNFRIVSAKSQLSDIKRKSLIENWKPKEEANEEVLRDFRSRVSADLTESPRQELMTLLAKELKANDPLRTIDTLLGKLISATDSKEFNQNSINDIWNELWKLKQDKERLPNGIHVWSNDDHPPAPGNIREGNIFFGAQPKLHLLREGYFCPRPEVYGKLVEEAINWLDSNPVNEDVSLPVFWIKGRSGCGKSVALLHLLSILYKEGFHSILWLGPNINILPKAVTFARNLQNYSNQPVLIGIDDPYSPDKEWKAAISILSDLIQDGNASALPIFFCCGPTEQLNQLEEDYDIQAETYDLPRIDSSDVEELRDWYIKRTSKIPPDSSGRYGENILLVQLFFEWHTGMPIENFAKKFRKRIQSFDSGLGQTSLADIVYRILALNRLYVGYPEEAIKHYLTNEQLDKFEEILVEEENHFFCDQDEQRHGYWLAHTHLANAIYSSDSWFGKGKYNRQKEHLEYGIKDSFEFESEIRNKTLPLWAISRSFRKGTEQFDRLFDKKSQKGMHETIIKMLRSVYKDWVQGHGGLLPLFLLPVWIQIRARQPDLILDPDPISLAIQQIKLENLEETGLRLTCHKLLQYFDVWEKPNRRKIQSAISSFLQAVPDWYEWPYIAVDFFNKTKTQDEQFLKLLKKWIRTKSSSPTSAIILRSLLQSQQPRSDCFDLACESLRSAPGDPAWGKVAKSVLADSVHGIPEEVFVWLRNHKGEMGSGLLIRELLNQKQGYWEQLTSEQQVEVRQIAIDWLERFYLETSSANLILEPLCKDMRYVEPIIIKMSLSWLEEFKEAWSSYLIEKLLDKINSNPYDFYSDERLFSSEEEIQLVSHAEDWLYTYLTFYDDNGRWSYLWCKIYDFLLGELNWFIEHINKSLSSYIIRFTTYGRYFLGLQSSNSFSEKETLLLDLLSNINSLIKSPLINLGLKRIYNSPEEDEYWAPIWIKLLSDFSDTGTLLQFGRIRLGIKFKCLDKSTNEKVYPRYIWEVPQEMLKYYHNDMEMLEMGKKALKCFDESSLWSFLMQDLLNIYPQDSELFDIGCRWLKKFVGTARSWPYVWIKMKNLYPNSQQLTDLAHEWLSQDISHDSDQRLTIKIKEMPPLTFKVGDVVTGVVRAVKPYGVFIDIGEVSALLHISEISHVPIDSPNVVLNVNDKIKVMLIGLDAERGRISVSTKQIEPSPGDMLSNPQKVYDNAEETAERYLQQLENET